MKESEPKKSKETKEAPLAPERLWKKPTITLLEITETETEELEGLEIQGFHS